MADTIIGTDGHYYKKESEHSVSHVDCWCFEVPPRCPECMAELHRGLEGKDHEPDCKSRPNL